MPTKRVTAAEKAAPAKAPARKPARKPTKRPAAGKAAPKRPPAYGELLALLPELDEEGIAFLLEQARVHRYNMEAARLEALAEKASQASVRAPSAAEPRPKPLRIERSADGSTYHIVAGSDWKMFTAEEMAALVRISRGGEGPEETGRRLRAWFARERRDVYLDLGLDGPSIGMARDIGAMILATFPPRGPK